MLTITRLALALLACALLYALGPANSLEASTFAPTATVKLCAYTGADLQSPCTTDNLAAGANTDITTVINIPIGASMPGVTTVLLPPGATIPGPETNTLCVDSVDSDGDTKVNDGCPSTGIDFESERCLGALDNDAADDAVGGGSRVNDGCPADGAPESGAQCTNATNDDGDSSVNDGCPAVGGIQAEANAWCTDSLDDDPRDDLANGASKVNDGCPTVGAAAEAGAQCDNALDDDPGDDGATPGVNDGCYPGGFGGIEAEVNECADAADNDGDGLYNDGCPTAATTTLPPVGAVAGKIYGNGTLGLINNACTSAPSTTNFPLLTGTTDNSLSMEYGSIPPQYASSEGPLEPFRDDGNGDKVPRHADRYPAFLNRILDPDRVGDINADGDEFDTVSGIAENPGASPLSWYGTVKPLRPLARYSGSIILQGEAQLVQLLTFNPGALAAFQPPHPLSDLGSASLGYPMIAVVGDPTIAPGPSAITDACTPSETRLLLWGTTRDNPCMGGTCTNSDTPCTLGCGSNFDINQFSSSSPAFDPNDGTGPCNSTDTAGCVRYANPSTAGTHYFYVYQQSARDQDRDGIENQLDTCPQTTNVEDPRSSAGPDFDMLDSACDPLPGAGQSNDNQDGDVSAWGVNWLNAGDNRPLVTNGDQKESELITKWSAAAKRGGSRADGMGDACDPSATAANGHFHSTWTVIPKCIGATDTDGDGWCDAQETTWGSCSANPCPAQYTGVGCPNCAATSTPEHYDVVVPLGLTHSGSGNYPTEVRAETACTGVIDDDDDLYINDGCPAAESGSQCTNTVDDDGDGFVNDGCPAVTGGAEQGAQCSAGNSNDDDTDGWVNDRCPASGAAETACADAVDDDGDTLVNDGCAEFAAEAGSGCTGASDNDADGTVNDGCPTVGGESGTQCFNATDDEGSGRTNDGCPAQVEREPRQVCGDGIDNDMDNDANGETDLLDVGCKPVSLMSHPAYPACPADGCPGIDTDGDGYTDEAEMSIGTDALGRCGLGAVPAQSIDWPSDLVSGSVPNSTDKINILDVASFTAPDRHLDTKPGDQHFDRRWDLQPGNSSSTNWIWVADISAMTSAGASTFPPMFNGAKAFGYSSCSPHPFYGD